MADLAKFFGFEDLQITSVDGIPYAQPSSGYAWREECTSCGRHPKYFLVPAEIALCRRCVASIRENAALREKRAGDGG